MFGLIRRISYSVIPRPDRPWEDDPTSNAPAKRKKRRMSSSERGDHDMEDEQSRKKKRDESFSPSSPSDELLSSPLTQPETEEVKEVTQGVKEVELEAKATLPPPESVPLPEEQVGELDVQTAENTPEPEAIVATQDQESKTEETSSNILEAQAEKTEVPLSSEGQQKSDLSEIKSQDPAGVDTEKPDAVLSSLPDKSEEDITKE